MLDGDIEAYQEKSFVIDDKHVPSNPVSKSTMHSKFEEYEQ